MVEDNLIYFNPARTKNFALMIDSRAAEIRLYWFTLPDANEDRRAEYEKGELAKLLGVSHQALTGAIRKAKRIGLIEPTSNSRCIVFGSNLAEKGGSE